MVMKEWEMKRYQWRKEDEMVILDMVGGVLVEMR